jgi:aldose sugar dehydrogenase
MPRASPVLLVLSLAAAICAAPVAACELVSDGWGPAGTVPIRAATVADGLEVPWGIGFLPNGDALVTERPGRVRLLRAGKLEPVPVATIPVAEEGEGGLLGIAIDPRFAENRRFYLYATVEAGGGAVNRLTRWTLAADGRSARQERVLLDGVAAERFHDGGRIRFGPDGMLHVGTGDAGEPERAQDPASPNGKILRLTPDGGIPPDNPTPGSAVLVSGARNVEAFDWLDRQTLVIADHGPSGERGRRGHDEVSLARAGANLGWPDVWRCEARRGVVTPVLVTRAAMPPGGASLYRGDAIPAWKGSLLIGTLGSRHLHRVVLGPDGGLVKHEVYLRGEPPGGLGRIRDVVQAPDGSLWVTTSNCDGRGTCPEAKDRIVRIVGG